MRKTTRAGTIPAMVYLGYCPSQDGYKKFYLFSFVPTTLYARKHTHCKVFCVVYTLGAVTVYTDTGRWRDIFYLMLVITLLILHFVHVCACPVMKPFDLWLNFVVCLTAEH